MAATEAVVTKSTIGLKDIVIAPITQDDADGTKYGTLQKLAGAMEMTITPENNEADVQSADDGEFDVVYPDPQYTISLQLADIPLKIRAQLLGNKMDDNGVLVRTSDDQPIYFAMGFRSEKSDHTYRYVWIYKLRADPIGDTFATREGDTVTRQTGTLTCTAIKRTSDKMTDVYADEGENGFTAEKAAAFLSGVYEPTISGT